MTYLVHQGKVLNDKKTTKENNIGAEATIEMSLRIFGGMEKGELMDTLETEEEREKKRKLEEMCEGKSTRPSEDAVFLRKEIIDALERSDEQMESYSKKTDEKMVNFLQTITQSVGTQLRGMNSTIEKMKEEDEVTGTNKSMKESRT